MAPIVRLIPARSAPWLWSASIIVSQRAARVWDEPGARRRVLRRWGQWARVIGPLLGLVERIGAAWGFDPGPLPEKIVNSTLWWVR